MKVRSLPLKEIHCSSFCELAFAFYGVSVFSFSCHPPGLAMPESLVAFPNTPLLSSLLTITESLESEKISALCKIWSSFRVFLSPSLHKSSPFPLIRFHCSLAWLPSLLVQGKCNLHLVITPLFYFPSFACSSFFASHTAFPLSQTFMLWSQEFRPK